MVQQAEALSCFIQWMVIEQGSISGLVAICGFDFSPPPDKQQFPVSPSLNKGDFRVDFWFGEMYWLHISTYYPLGSGLSLG